MIRRVVEISHASYEHAEVQQSRVKQSLPENGEVRMICMTDKQFERMQIYHGRLPRTPEAAPQQVSLF